MRTMIFGGSKEQAKNYKVMECIMSGEVIETWRDLEVPGKVEVLHVGTYERSREWPGIQAKLLEMENMGRVTVMVEGW